MLPFTIRGFILSPFFLCRCGTTLIRIDRQIYLKKIITGSVLGGNCCTIFGFPISVSCVCVCGAAVKSHCGRLNASWKIRNAFRSIFSSGLCHVGSFVANTERCCWPTTLAQKENCFFRAVKKQLNMWNAISFTSANWDLHTRRTLCTRDAVCNETRK